MNRTSDDDDNSDIFVHPKLALTLRDGIGVLSFGESSTNGVIPVREYEKPIRELAQQPGCRMIEFDLEAVRHIPSGLLGLMTSLMRDYKVPIQVRHCSGEVREALAVTKLDRMIRIVG